MRINTGAIKRRLGRQRGLYAVTRHIRAFQRSIGGLLLQPLGGWRGLLTIRPHRCLWSNGRLDCMGWRFDVKEGLGFERRLGKLGRRWGVNLRAVLVVIKLTPGKIAFGTTSRLADNRRFTAQTTIKGK